MANSTFPINIQPGGLSNPAIIRGWKDGSIGYPPGFQFWHRTRVKFARGEFTPAAATSQEIDLNVTYASLQKRFPANVQRMPGSFVNVLVPISGTAIVAATAELGDNGDPNGIFTASGVWTGVSGRLASTPGAAENTARPEPTFAPTLTIRLTGANMTAIEAGDLVCCIPYRVMVP
jgi:hypothetical protein